MSIFNLSKIRMAIKKTVKSSSALLKKIKHWKLIQFTLFVDSTYNNCFTPWQHSSLDNYNTQAYKLVLETVGFRNCIGQTFSHKLCVSPGTCLDYFSNIVSCQD